MSQGVVKPDFKVINATRIFLLNRAVKLSGIKASRFRHMGPLSLIAFIEEWKKSNESSGRSTV